MRSRYTAFVRGKFPYFTRTMRGEALVQFNMQAAQHDFAFIKWQKLEVLHSQHSENTGIVEFKADFKYQGQMQVLHEISRFENIAGEWFYIGQLANDK